MGLFRNEKPQLINNHLVKVFIHAKK